MDAKVKNRIITAARTKIEPTKNITLRLPVSLLDSLKKKCDQEKVKPNAVIEELIKDFMSKS